MALHGLLLQVDTPEHRALALDAALQGFVLMRNDPPQHTGAGDSSGAGGGNVLPLGPATKLAVLGPNAAGGSGTQWQLGNYHERAEPPGVLQSPCSALAAMAGNGGGAAQVTCPGADGCT